MNMSNQMNIAREIIFKHISIYLNVRKKNHFIKIHTCISIQHKAPIFFSSKTQNQAESFHQFISERASLCSRFRALK